jgi:cyclohexanone monooxygenase
MVYMIESHLNNLSSTLKTMERDRLATFEVRPDVQREYNQQLQARMSRNNTTLWPSFTFVFRQLTRRFDPAAYYTTPVTDRAHERVSA